MKTIVDDFGNQIMVVDAQAPKATKKKRVSRKKASDYDMAQMVLEAWGKPMAFHGGEMWSFDPATGWTVASEHILSLANQMKGCNTKSTVWEILVNQHKTPSCDTHPNPSTYWERVRNRWEPFPVNSNQVLFANGILTINPTGIEFEPTEERAIFGPRITIPFDDDLFDQHCSEFEDLIDFALPEPEHRVYLQKLCSLILQPHVLLRGQVVFWGVPHSGKSTLATAIGMAPGGLTGASYQSEKRLTKDKWATISLLNKFINVSNDSDFSPSWESFMKDYTTGMVSVEPKFHKPTSLPATAKLFTTCNEFQKLKDMSGAAQQRYRVFEFTKPIPESATANQSEKMTPGYWCDESRRVGVLAWLLRGLELTLSEGLLEPKSLQAVKQRAVGEGNPAIAWLSDNVEPAENEFLPSSAIAEGMLSDNIEPLHGPVLAKFMFRMFGVQPTKEKRVRGYKNVKLIK